MLKKQRCSGLSAALAVGAAGAAAACHLAIHNCRLKLQATEGKKQTPEKTRCRKTHKFSHDNFHHVMRGRSSIILLPTCFPPLVCSPAILPQGVVRVTTHLPTQYRILLLQVHRPKRRHRLLHPFSHGPALAQQRQRTNTHVKKHRATRLHLPEARLTGLPRSGLWLVPTMG